MLGNVLERASECDAMLRIATTNITTIATTAITATIGAMMPT